MDMMNRIKYSFILLFISQFPIMYSLSQESDHKQHLDNPLERTLEEIDHELRVHHHWIKSTKDYMTENKETLKGKDHEYREHLSKQIKFRRRLIRELNDKKCQIFFHKNEVKIRGSSLVL